MAGLCISEYTSPREMLCFEQPERMCQNVVYAADTNAFRAFHTHASHLALANPEGTVFPKTTDKERPAWNNQEALASFS